MIEYAQHQLEASNFGATRPASIYAMATGTGKTVTTIATILRLLEANNTNKNLICATKASLPEIMNDFRKFYGFEPQHIYDNEQMNNFFDGQGNVGILRYEYFRKIDPLQFKARLHNSRSSLFIDEAQKLKNQSTQAHKYVKNLRTSVDYFNLMTATPLMTSLDDMHSLMYLVDPRALGDYDTFVNNYYERELVPKFPNLLKGMCPNCRRYSTYWRFRDGLKYCPYCGLRKRVQCRYETVAYKNLYDLSSRLKDYMYCYYPQQDINYVMHQTALSNYSTYTNIAHDVLNNNETPFATRMIELQRCTSYDVNKIKLLKTVVEQVIDTGCVIYCAFIDSVKIVQALLDSMGIESKVISGEVSDADREHVKSWFKQDASNKVLIITSAGGASLNLQVTPHLISMKLHGV